MAIVPESTSAVKFAFSSNVAADVWHPQKDSKAYEWWYFDALSDDGSEAVVIVFLDNFIYSPRYNDTRVRGAKFPAVSITYYREGKAVYRAVNEYPESEFSASQDRPECRIGKCSFTFETAAYGSGYLVNVNMALSGDRRLEGKFEWLSIESDFACEGTAFRESSHCWNMAVPRADVTGKIEVKNKLGETIDLRRFRGTGYHDHNLDNRWLAKTVRDWHWGRAHFADAHGGFLPLL